MMEESHYTILVERNVQLKDFQVIVTDVEGENADYAQVTENSVNNYNYYGDLFEYIIEVMFDAIYSTDMLPGDYNFSQTSDYEVVVSRDQTKINMYSIRFETRFTERPFLK